MPNDARTSVVRASLQARIRDLRKAERNCRCSYRQAYMGEATNFLADTYDEAARVLERRLVEWENEYAKAPTPAANTEVSDG